MLQRELPTITKRGLQKNLHRTVELGDKTGNFHGALKRDGREFYVVVSPGERHRVESGSSLIIYKDVIGKPRGYSEVYSVSL